jgi:hypothetical protein
MSTPVEQADTPVETHVRLAPVIPIEHAMRPRHTATARVLLPECLTDLLHSVQLNGSIDAVLPPAITWADVMAWAATDSEPPIVIDGLTDPFAAAIADAGRDLACLGARPRLHLHIAFGPDLFTVAVRGLLADPVMTPSIADSITADLAAASPTGCRLDVTDRGTLHWQPSGLSAPVPLDGIAQRRRRG